MSDLHKTYHGSVFSHKRGQWGGVDQGKGLLYRGNTVEFALNVWFGDNVFTVREGQELVTISLAGITAGNKSISGLCLVSGTNAYFDESTISLNSDSLFIIHDIAIESEMTGSFEKAPVLLIESAMSGEFTAGV